MTHFGMTTRDDYYLALGVVALAFNGKTDKAGEPYINHLKRVAAKVPKPLKTAALLHDVLEDCGGVVTYEFLAVHFGRNVADVVLVLTKGSDLYSEYIDKICAAGIAAAVIKKADLEDNLDVKRLGDNLSYKDIKRIKKYKAAYKKICKIVG